MGIKAWITVRGQHIPIMDGESKMSAVGRFIKGKNKQILKNRDKDFFKSVKQHQKENKNSKEDYKKSDSYNYWRANQDMGVKYGPNWDKQSKRWIRGRAKTTEEIKAMGKRLAATKNIDYNDPNNWISFDNWANQRSAKDRYKLKEDKPKRAAKGELTEKKLYLDYKNNYTTDELKAYKSQLDRHYRRFKNSNKNGDDITARNYRAITTVLAERRKRK